MTGQGEEQISSLIVPAWLSHKEDPSHKLLVYSLLDDQSYTTFTAKETLCQLGVQGHQTQLLLSTMHRKDAAISSEKVNGLLVQDYKSQVTIALPNTFSAQSIPARREQIPKPETALNWAHTKKIAGQLMPYRDDVKVGLLIGSNCARVIVPREVIPGNWNQLLICNGKVTRYPSEECNSPQIRADSCSSVHQGQFSPATRTTKT